MKRLVLFFVLLPFFELSSAQTGFLFGDEDEYIEKMKILEDSVRNEFAHLTKEDLYHLIPFNEKTNYGFFDARTGKVVIKPQYSKFDNGGFFSPNRKIGFNNCDFCYIEINTEGDSIRFESYLDIDGAVVMSVPQNGNAISSDDKFSGFSVDSLGNLNTYADTYKVKWDAKPFLFKGKYYLIVEKNKRMGIIDEKGKSLKGFDFNYLKISINSHANIDDQLWFHVEADANENYNQFFVNTKGKTKYKEDDSFRYVRFGSPVFAYSSAEIFERGTALMDMQSMEWIIAPQNKVKIRALYYSSHISLDTSNVNDRAKAKIYLDVYDYNETKNYCMDMAGNKFQLLE